MINSKEELGNLLATTVLAENEIVELPVPECDKSAFGIAISRQSVESGWKTARGLLQKTERWPVVSNIWSSAEGSFEERVGGTDLFSRFFYREAPENDDVSPQAVLDRSSRVDVGAFVMRLDKISAEDYDAEWVEELLVECETTVGRRPKDDELDAGIRNPAHRLDKWLFEIQVATVSIEDMPASPFEWFDPEDPVLLLLPTVSGWESLAYLHFYGAYLGSENYIAIGKSWERRFGAELVAHFGTMLQCFVERPPIEPGTAWQLAREHDLVAGSTLAPSGVEVREYASCLLGGKRWFLHDRP